MQDIRQRKSQLQQAVKIKKIYFILIKKNQNYCFSLPFYFNVLSTKIIKCRIYGRLFVFIGRKMHLRSIKCLWMFVILLLQIINHVRKDFNMSKLLGKISRGGRGDKQTYGQPTKFQSMDLKKIFDQELSKMNLKIY